jgi:hypothetical protein
VAFGNTQDPFYRYNVIVRLPAHDGLRATFEGVLSDTPYVSGASQVETDLQALCDLLTDNGFQLSVARSEIEESYIEPTP